MARGWRQVFVFVLCVALATVSFEVTPAGADFVSPDLVTMSVSPLSVDISATDKTVTFRLRVSDSGSSGVTSVCVFVGTPAGDPYSDVCMTAADRISGDAFDGIYERSLTFPRYSHTGSHPLAVMLLDTSGNLTIYSTAGLHAFGFPSMVGVTGTEDLEAPTVSSVSFTPSVWDLADGPATVEVTAHVHDPLAGFDYGCIEFDLPAGVTGSEPRDCFFEPDDRISGTATDGVYSTTLTFGALAAPGVYSVSELFLRDRVRNAETLTAAEIVAKGAPAALTLTNSIATVPDPPTNVIAVNAGTFAGLSWTPPVNIGHTALTGYRIIASPGGMAKDVPANVTQTEIGPLLGGTQYTFQVQARNAIGLGAASAASNEITVPARPPEHPENVVAVAGIASATVSWTAPEDGGSPITSYTVSTTGTSVTVPADQTSATITGLLGGSVSYQFAVRATNAQGDSVPASANAIIVHGVPHAAQNPEATAGDQQVTLSWSAPFNDGGSPITSYTISTPGFSATVPGTQTSGTVTGLTNGTPYAFRVVATNEFGTGAPSQSVESTPHPPPPAPTDVVATPLNARARVSWVQPCCQWVSSYVVTVSPGGATVTTGGTGTGPRSLIVSGLTNGIAYSFTVVARDSAGSSPASAPSAPVTPFPYYELPPEAPTGVTAAALNGAATLSWTPPPGPTTSYAVTTTPGFALHNVAGDVSSFVVPGLTNGVSYTFRVAAINANGASPYSAPSNAVTPTAGGTTTTTTVPPTTTTTTTTVPPTTTTTTTTVPSTTTTKPKPPPSPPAKSGYWMLGADGAVYAFGDAPRLGGVGTPAVAMAARPQDNGYWVVNAAGAVYARGAAKRYGNPPALAAGERVSTISSTRTGNGYWLFSNRGRAFPYGDATFFGDMRNITLNGPIVASVATPTGRGYYMVASDGGIFAFGDARFHGSMGGTKLNRPVVGISPTPDNKGYWLVASDGGVFAFNAPFRGSMGAVRLNRPVNGLVAFGNGYLMVASDGGVFNFSNKPFLGSLASRPPSAPILGIAAVS
jgi:titin